jgi:hypothetical protein
MKSIFSDKGNFTPCSESLAGSEKRNAKKTLQTPVIAAVAVI